MDKKLSFTTKAGYGFGMAGECIAMNTFYIYFLFFLTDGVGMAAGIAGTIAMIATFLATFTDLFAGNRSDASKNPNGRRRPFIFKFAVPLGIMMILMYTDWSAIPMGVKPVYFLIMAAAFWLFLSLTDVPYQSLGAEITEDYLEKNQIRAYGNIMNYAGMILASSGTLTLVAIFSANGNITGAWSKVGLIFGIITMLCFWISAWVTKGKEPANPNVGRTDKEETEKFISMLKGSLSIKPFRNLIIYVMLGNGGMLLFTSMYIYYLSYNMGWSEAKSATLMLIYSFMVMGVSALLGAVKIEKKTMLIVCTLGLGIVSIIAHFIAMNTALVYIYFFCFAFGISAYFVTAFSMVYDICDIDEFKSGGKRAGGIVSVFLCASKIVCSIALLVVGWILELSGYDPMAVEQTAEALNGISSGTFLIPGIAICIAGLIMLKYPINKKNHAALRAATEKKYSGEEYSTEGFEELL